MVEVFDMVKEFGPGRKGLFAAGACVLRFEESELKASDLVYLGA